MSETKTSKLEIKELMLGQLHPSATNPRKKFPAARQRELEASLREIGVLEPLLVRQGEMGQYEIVAGERRWRAAGEIGMLSLPCVVREMSDADVLLAQLAENVVRNDLSPVEEWHGIEGLRRCGWEDGEVAERLGVSVRWVQDRLALGEVPAAARSAVDAGKLGLGAVREVLKVEAEDREGFVQEMLGWGENLSVFLIREIVAERYVGPRRRREAWRKWWNGKRKRWEGIADPVEDPELWAEHVMPWGVGAGKWRAGDTPIAGLAVRPEEGSTTWGQLAEAHGLRGVLVPVGGVREGVELDDIVVVVVDSAVVTAAERAAREAGQPHTIGPRLARVEDPAPTVEEVVHDDLAPAWSPAVFLDVELGAVERDRLIVAEAILDTEYTHWREDALEDLGVECAEGETLTGAVRAAFGEWWPVVAWWILRDGNAGEECYEKIATMLGVRETWLEAIGQDEEGGAR